MVLTYLFRLIGAGCVVALITNVYKHGWHLRSIALGVFLSLLMLSLGVAPERRTRSWTIRYLLAIITMVGLLAFRFLA